MQHKKRKKDEPVFIRRNHRHTGVAVARIRIRRARDAAEGSQRMIV